MAENIEMRDVDNFCAGVIGAPGERIFFFQAVDGDLTVTIKTEKEHVIALVVGMREVLRDKDLQPEPSEVAPLRPPNTVAFDVTQIGIGVVSDRDTLVVVLRSAVQSDDDPDPDVGEGEARAELWLTPEQAAGFCRQAELLLEEGRDFGRRNGHQPSLGKPRLP